MSRSATREAPWTQRVKWAEGTGLPRPQGPPLWACDSVQCLQPTFPSPSLGRWVGGRGPFCPSTWAVSKVSFHTGVCTGHPSFLAEPSGPTEVWTNPGVGGGRSHVLGSLGGPGGQGPSLACPAPTSRLPWAQLDVPFGGKE